MRGTIAAIAPDGTYGQIAAEDGHRYSYWTSEIRNGPAHTGQAVDFQIWEGQPVDIFIHTMSAPKGPPPQRAAAPQGAVAVQGQAASYSPAAPRFGASAPPAYADVIKGLPPANYWIKLFTSPSGRVSRLQFWLHGMLPIVLANILLVWIPFIGQLIALLLLWASICLGFKRFHDLGYPGWWSLVYLVPLFAAGVFLILGFAMTSFLSVAWLLAEILAGVSFLIGIAQLVLVYIRLGQEGPNQYGPDPLAV